MLDPSDDARSASEYFEKLAMFAPEALERCGYPPCIGEWMASNPRWRLPLLQWQALFRSWITEVEYRSAEDAHHPARHATRGGDFSLHQQLAASVGEQFKAASFFKSILALASIGRKPPLGFF